MASSEHERRNERARRLGYRNYYDMRKRRAEGNPTEADTFAQRRIVIDTPAGRQVTVEPPQFHQALQQLKIGAREQKRVYAIISWTDTQGRGHATDLWSKGGARATWIVARVAARRGGVPGLLRFIIDQLMKKANAIPGETDLPEVDRIDAMQFTLT